MPLPAEHPARQGLKPLAQFRIGLQKILKLERHSLHGGERPLVGLGEVLQCLEIILWSEKLASLNSE